MKITAIKQQEKLKDRYSVFVDEKYSFSLSERALLDSRIASGQELGKTQLEAFRQMSSDDKLYGMALRWTAARLRSEWEIRQYLTRKQTAPALADEIVGKLENLGFVDDANFARAWVENRRTLKPTSKRKLQMELKSKHIRDDIIQEALWASEGDDRTALQELIVRKRRQLKYQDDQKLMQYLARQGFGFDDIKSALSSTLDS